MTLDEHGYATTTLLESDKGCAIWLIRRSIDSEATFQMRPKGTLRGPI